VNVRDNMSGSEHSEPGRPGANDEPGNPEGDGPPYSGASSGKRQRKIVLLGASVAAAAVFTAIGFGAVSVIRDQVTSAAASAAIPSPPLHNQRFVEDDEGTGADSQANILQSTVPGLVRVVSPLGGAPA
jgi:hypothetical protein